MGPHPRQGEICRVAFAVIPGRTSDCKRHILYTLLICEAPADSVAFSGENTDTYNQSAFLGAS